MNTAMTKTCQVPAKKRRCGPNGSCRSALRPELVTPGFTPSSCAIARRSSQVKAIRAIVTSHCTIEPISQTTGSGSSASEEQ